MPIMRRFACSVVVLTGVLSMPLAAEQPGDAAREPIEVEKDLTPRRSDTARDVDQANRLGSSSASARREARPPLTGGVAKPAQAGVAVRLGAMARPADADAGVRVVEVGNRPAESPARPDQVIKFFPLPAGQVLQRVFVGADPNEPEVAGESERLVYSNTLGRFVAAFPVGRLVTDDISLNASIGCNLRRYSFQATGKADPNGTDGAYTVEFALYDNCPSAGGEVIPGTIGSVSFTAAQVAMNSLANIVVVVPDGIDVPIPSTVWLGVTVDRKNSGLIIGAPALVGFSGDVIDFPLANCSGHLGGFPQQPHASFNAELYVDGTCPEAFPAYRNMNPGRGGINEGRNVRFADDVELQVDTCDLIGYEIGVRGQAAWSLDIRGDEGGFPGAVIAGTEGFFITQSENAQIGHILIDPPIFLNSTRMWVTVKPNARTGRWILVGRDATVGRTAITFAVLDDDTGQWDIRFPDRADEHGGFYANLFCAGQIPVGACCDMYQTDENGDSACREVPEMNCPFPGRGLVLQPSWIKAASCDPDPFRYPCGQSACCRPDDTCENLTQNECDAVEPVELFRDWQRGRYCDEDFQECPYSACLQWEGSCTLAHESPGCENQKCCQDVCEADPFCCLVEWDRTCLELVGMFCPQVAPENDICAPTSRLEGALLLDIPGSAITPAHYATTGQNDPGFCCHTGFEPVCKNPFFQLGLPCEDDTDCPDGWWCPQRRPRPGDPGYGTVWYKFFAIHTSVELTTGYSDPPAEDLLIQVFVVGDPTSDETACDSLESIACLDEQNLAGGNEPVQKLCVRNLVPGDLYYVMVAAKTPADQGLYRLTIDAPCEPRVRHLNDNCADAQVIAEGTTPWDMVDATMECPSRVCDVPLERDLWYEFVPHETRSIHIGVCGPQSKVSTPVTLAVYEGCDCPPVMATEVVCQHFSNTQCAEVNAVLLDVVAGQCYRIRLGSSSLEPLNGELCIGCRHCPRGDIYWRFVGESGVQIDGMVDARRPHDPNDNTIMEGIDVLRATGPALADPGCWSICETSLNPDLHPPYPPEMQGNQIVDVEVLDDRQYLLHLKRPLTPGEVTTIIYTQDNGVQSTGRFTAHPGDVNGDGTADADDVAEWVDFLENRCIGSFCPGPGDPVKWPHQVDINRDGRINPTDLLELIDLLTGTGAFEPWLGSTVPGDSTTCP